MSHLQVAGAGPSLVLTVPFLLFNNGWCRRFLRWVFCDERSDWPRALPLHTQVTHRGDKAWVKTTRRSGVSGLRARSFIFVSHVYLDCRLILKRLISLTFISIITRSNERVVSASWSQKSENHPSFGLITLETTHVIAFLLAGSGSLRGGLRLV